MALPRTLGAMTVRTTEPTTRATTLISPRFSVVMSPNRRLTDGQKCLAFRGGAPPLISSSSPLGMWSSAGATTVSAEVSSAVSLHLLRRQLGFDDLALGRVRLGEFLVGAAADDPSRVEDDDLVGPADGRHALGDDDDRGLTGRFVEGGPQPRVGGDVEGGERIVEDVDLRFDG